MMADYEVTLDLNVVERFLNGAQSVEVNAFDLYDAIIKDQKRQLANKEFVTSIYQKKSESLSQQIVALNVQLAELTESNQSTVSALHECQSDNSELQSRIDFLTEEFTRFPQQVAVSVEDKALKQSVYQLKQERESLLEEISTLKEQNTFIEAQSLSMISSYDKMIVRMNEEITNTKALYENKLKALESQLTEKYTTELNILKNDHKVVIADKSKEFKKIETELDKKSRALAVTETYFKQAKKRNIENREFMENSLKSMNMARNQIRDMEHEIAELRTDRRYLTVMMDAITHQDVFTCDDGVVSLFSTQTQEIKASQGTFEINTQHPIGLWLGKNGYACVLAVAKEPDQDGNPLIAMPAYEETDDDVEYLKFAQPPEEHFEAIAKILMQYDVDKITDSFQRSRQVCSQLAKDWNFLENRLQENPNLVAKYKIAAGGETVTRRKTQASKKRKHK